MQKTYSTDPDWGKMIVIDAVVNVVEGHGITAVRDAVENRADFYKGGRQVAYAHQGGNLLFGINLIYENLFDIDAINEQLGQYLAERNLMRPPPEKPRPEDYPIECRSGGKTITLEAMGQGGELTTKELTKLLYRFRRRS